MSRKSTTKEELFLLRLYEISGGSCDIAVDSRLVTSSQNSQGIKNTIQHLAQANFVKKVGEQQLQITVQGLNLIRRLLFERG